MCGFAGIFDPSTDGTSLAQQAARMGETLRHRGPDSASTWADPHAGFAVNHQRLAVVDLTDAGAQPMVSANGRYVIAFNGEIYNSSNLSVLLRRRGAVFRGHSDTEVLLEACAHWGITEAAKRAIGMFAFVVWDTIAQTVSLVRDRLGIKPLFWALSGERLTFGSEVRALRVAMATAPRLDRRALEDFLCLNYVPGEQTIFQDVRRLAPGSILRFKAGSSVEVEQFWSLDAVREIGRADPFQGSALDAEDALDELLQIAIGDRLIADVPLGAFLSGGVDSSIVAAIMCAGDKSRIRTFTVGFDVPQFDESRSAQSVADYLGTDHTRYIASADEAAELLPKLATLYDEPFGDSSQIPTYMVSQLARRHVTVALSGDGGDELFAGYDRYFQLLRILPYLKHVPRSLRMMLGQALAAMPEAVRRIVPKGALLSGERFSRLRGMLEGTPSEAYRSLVSHWSNPGLLVAEGEVPSFPDFSVGGSAADVLDDMRQFDTSRYLPDDILTKLDRASMAHSLEARVPLLDHRVVEFAWSLKPNLLLGPDPWANGIGKWLLKRVLARYVPPNLHDRPKSGFGVPLDAWLRGPLRGWAEQLLSVENLAADGMFDVAFVRGKWQDHINGREEAGYPLWTVLSYLAWRLENRDVVVS